jgi:hypothetical protein
MLLDGVYFRPPQPVIDPGGVKQFDKRYGRLANVDLVVAYPDVVVGVAIDDDISASAATAPISSRLRAFRERPRALRIPPSTTMRAI